MTTKPVSVGTLKKGSTVVIDGAACKVTDTQISRPGKHGHAQMLSDNILKTKQIAQLRILVEQVIRRVKCFRMLPQELAINFLHHVDDILIICAASVNMKRPIMK